MAKLTAQEFIKKWTEEKGLTIDEDTQIEMMEDISDSISSSDTESEEVTKLKADLEKVSADYADLKERYKLRFMSTEAEEEKTEEEVEDEEPKEEEVIDIKEI